MDGTGFRRLRWTGFIVVVMSLAVTAAAPRKMGPLPDGMKTPALAMELVRSVSEVERMFAAPGSEERAAWTAGMRRSNEFDFALAGAYGLFLWAIARTLARAGARGAIVGQALAIVAPVCDVLENREILVILSSLGKDYQGALGRLEVFTWVKWISLGLFFVVSARGLFRVGVAFRVSAIFGCAAALFSLAAIVVRGPLAELMGLTVALAILALAAGCLFAKQ